MSVSLSLEEAANLAAFAYEIGETDQARRLVRQILQGRPNDVPALLVDFCLAWKARDAARARAILDLLWKNLDALKRVPRLPAVETVPRLTSTGLATMFPGGGPTATDISDHLGDLYFEAVSTKPKLIVELGTRGGESTRALLAASIDTGARMLSVDIDPCAPELPEPARMKWSFQQSDDVAFGRERFVDWCAERGVEPLIDVLFIDTSHLYQHTCEELAVWMPLVAPRGVALFHDTNLYHYTVRVSGALERSWDNERGVIRAIEEYFGVGIDERKPAAGVAGMWAFRHNPRCNGFTVLRRLA